MSSRSESCSSSNQMKLFCGVRFVPTIPPFRLAICLVLSTRSSVQLYLLLSFSPLRHVDISHPVFLFSSFRLASTLLFVPHFLLFTCAISLICSFHRVAVYICNQSGDATSAVFEHSPAHCYRLNDGARPSSPANQSLDSLHQEAAQIFPHHGARPDTQVAHCC